MNSAAQLKLANDLGMKVDSQKIKKFATRTIRHIFGLDDLKRCVRCSMQRGASGGSGGGGGGGGGDDEEDS